MLYLIWKSVVHRKIQSIITVLAVGISVAALFTMALIYKGTSDGLEKAGQKLGADILVMPGAVALESGTILFTGAPVDAYFSEDTLAIMRSTRGVSQATPQFYSQLLPDKCCNSTFPARIIGFDPESDWSINPWLKPSIQTSLLPNQAIIGPRVDVDDGKHLMLFGEMFTVADVLEYTGTSMDSSIILPLDVARNLVKESDTLSTLWHSNGQPENLLSAVLVQLEHDADRESVIADIHSKGDYRVLVAADVLQQLRKQVASVLSLTAFTGIILLIASAIPLFMRFYTLSIESQRKWRLGVEMRDSRKVVPLVVEALTLAFSGIIVGIVIGSVLYGIVLDMLRSNYGFPFINPGLIFIGIFIALIALFYIVISILATWTPKNLLQK